MADLSTLLTPLLKGLAWLLEKLFKRLRRAESELHLPTQTLRVVPDADQHFSWGLGTKGDAPVMAVRGNFYLTNITNNVDVMITRIFLEARFWKQWRPRCKRYDGTVLLAPPGNPFQGVWSSKYSIPRGETREARGLWLVDPPIKTKGETLKGRAYFVDQLGNEHRAKTKQTFRYT